jgi:putative transposase
VPYSKRAHTFRTAVGDFPAARARLGSPSLVGFKEHGSVPAGFVTELRPQHAPARIQDGLRHPGLDEFGRADIADDDQGVVADDPRRRLVELMFARVGDLGVDRADAALVTGALLDRERCLVLAVVAQGRDGRAVAQCGRRLQTKIDTDRAVAGQQIICDLALENNIPSAARVLDKAAGFESLWDIARLPEPEPALEVRDLWPIDLHSARDKRHPPERPLGAKAGAEARTFALGVARGCELAADRLHGVGVQPEQRATAGAELDQVVGAEPRLAPTLGLALRRHAEVPNLIGRIGMPGKVFAGGCVLDAVFETEHHAQTHNWSRGKMQEFRTGRHCVFALHVHLVFVTKYRRDVLSELAIRDLTAIFARICKDFEATLVECSGEDDHVHLLVEYPPKITLSKLVNSLKGVSSRLVREMRPEITGRYFKGVLWSPSYFAASCGGAPISIIRQYIEQQRSALPPRPERRGFRALRG